MSLLRLKASWDEDDTTYRTIEVLSTQSFFELHQCLKVSYQLPTDMEASIFVCDSRGIKGRKISSIVEKNLRDAPALSMKKTPLGALINEPHQLFVYECEHPKQWIFQIEIINMLPIPTLQKDYPICVQSEGLSPSQYGVNPAAKEKDKITELLELYDLDDKDGFGDEGEEEINDSEEEFDTESSDDVF